MPGEVRVNAPNICSHDTIIDVRNPRAPRIVGELPSSGHLAFTDVQIFVASWDNVDVLPAQCGD